MMKLIDIVLLILEIISFIFTIIYSSFGIYEQIVGPAGAEELLKKLHIPLSYDQAFIIGLACVAIMIITHVLRTKLSGKL